MEVRIENSWKKALQAEFNSRWFETLTEKVKDEYRKYTVYPRGGDIFNAYDTTPLDKVKVVILGQDPYHGPGQAHGLSFSVKKGIRQPPSLQNIFKELHDDLGVPVPDKFNGELTRWAKNGVFLLNAILTVRANSPASHREIGWQQFTDATIRAISDQRQHVVFILWGSFARKKKGLIDTSKHLIIESPHPSPFSARNGFFGSKPFSRTNEYLIANNIEPVKWNID